MIEFAIETFAMTFGRVTLGLAVGILRNGPQTGINRFSVSNVFRYLKIATFA